jgi:hypothetical protein
VIVAFDVLPTQVKLLKEGWATTLIGQRPMTMGGESVKQLDELGKGSKVPAVTDTGVDAVIASNVDTFAGRKYPGAEGRAQHRGSCRFSNAERSSDRGGNPISPGFWLGVKRKICCQDLTYAHLRAPDIF